MNACLRCGTFLREAEPLAGVALCGACLAGDRKSPDPTTNWAPRFMVQRRLVVLAVLTVSAVVAWVALGGLARAIARPSLIAGSFPVVLLYALGVYLVLAYLPHGSTRWKREVLERVGIDRARGEPFRLVIAAFRRPSASDWRNPIEVGLFIAGDGGGAFLGEDGTRLVVPAADVVSARVELLWQLWPPRHALVLATAEHERFFAFIDAHSRRANEEEAWGWARRFTR